MLFVTMQAQEGGDWSRAANESGNAGNKISGQVRPLSEYIPGRMGRRRPFEV